MSNSTVPTKMSDDEKIATAVLSGEIEELGWPAWASANGIADSLVLRTLYSELLKAKKSDLKTQTRAEALLSEGEMHTASGEKVLDRERFEAKAGAPLNLGLAGDVLRILDRDIEHVISTVAEKKRQADEENLPWHGILLRGRIILMAEGYAHRETCGYASHAELVEGFLTGYVSAQNEEKLRLVS